MLKRLLWTLGILGGLALALVLLGPLLIPTASQGGAAAPRDLARAESRFIRIPFPGTTGIDIHYLAFDKEATDRDLNIDKDLTADKGLVVADNPAAGQDGPEETSQTTFLLLHGFTFNSFTWVPLLPFFAEVGRVLAYDQIPYGLSAKLTAADWQGPNPYAKEAALEQLFAFMDAQGVGRAFLVGNSSGGTLAMEAALARPERVAGLILVAPWVYARRPTMPAWVAELPQLRRLSLFIGRKLGEGVLLDYSYADPGRIPAERRSLMTLHAQARDWDLAWGEILDRSLSSPVTVSARLGELSLPVLLLSGDQDKVVPLADTRRVAETLPNGTLAILAGCGHVPQEECPSQFERVVTPWLQAQGAPFAAPPVTSPMALAPDPKPADPASNGQSPPTMPMTSGAPALSN